MTAGNEARRLQAVPDQETDIRSPDARSWIVRRDESDQREWIRGARLCGLLAQRQILHTGVGITPGPFEVVRLKQGGSYFLACLSGRGQVLVDGRWQNCGPGTAFLLPPGTRQAFRLAGNQPWEFCWVRYSERPGQTPLARAGSPVLARYAGEPLRLAIMGLYHESTEAAWPAGQNQWLDLIDGYVRQFAEPRQMDPRLWRLWEAVEADLAADWSNSTLARYVHLSEKQLERLCRQELGRTPRQQLIWLRMRRAADLLRHAPTKIEHVAAQVGYSNPFVFSSTFKRLMGSPPSQYGQG